MDDEDLSDLAEWQKAMIETRRVWATFWIRREMNERRRARFNRIVGSIYGCLGLFYVVSTFLTGELWHLITAAIWLSGCYFFGFWMTKSTQANMKHCRAKYEIEMASISEDLAKMRQRNLDDFNEKARKEVF